MSDRTAIYEQAFRLLNHLNVTREEMDALVDAIIEAAKEEAVEAGYPC